MLVQVPLLPLSRQDGGGKALLVGVCGGLEENPCMLAVQPLLNGALPRGGLVAVQSMDLQVMR